MCLGVSLGGWFRVDFRVVFGGFHMIFDDFCDFGVVRDGFGVGF